MNTQEYSRFLLEYQDKTPVEPFDESAAKDIAQLVSGSLIYRLYESLVTSDYPMGAVTEHLEMLYKTDNRSTTL